MNHEAANIRAIAQQAAIEYGYTDETPSDGLHAPLGKFESEPYYTLYFYNQLMNGDGEPLCDGETCDGDVLDVSDAEREAFELCPETTAVVLWHSESGFETLQELTEKQANELHTEYAQSDDSEEAA